MGQFFRYKLKILSYGIWENFSLNEELKPKFLSSCFVNLVPCHKWGDKFWHIVAWYQTHMKSHAMQRFDCFSEGNSISIYPNLKLISFCSYRVYWHRLPKIIAIPLDEKSFSPVHYHFHVDVRRTLCMRGACVCACVLHSAITVNCRHIHMIQQVMRHPCSSLYPYRWDSLSNNKYASLLDNMESKVPIVSLAKEAMMRKFIHVKPIRCVQFYGQVSMLQKVLKSDFKLYSTSNRYKKRTQDRETNTVSDFKSWNWTHLFE